MQRWLNVAAGLLVAAVLLGGAFRPAVTPAGGGVKPEPGYLAPEIAGRSPDGTPIRLSDLRGKAVFVNFWATWCPPCQLEMPDIDRLAAQLPEGTAILTVNATDTEASPEQVRRFLEVRKYRFPVVMDPRGEALRAYAISGLPTSFFINPQGVITRRIAGPLTQPAMRAELHNALKGGLAGGGPVRTLPALPEIVTVGHVGLRLPLLLMVVGTLVTAALASPAFRRRHLPSGFPGDLALGMLIAGIVGTRVGAVVADPATYITRPATLLSTPGGTGAVLGGFAGVLLWGYLSLRRLGRMPNGRYSVRRIWQALDALAAPLLAGGAIAAAGALGPGPAAGLLLAAVASAALTALIRDSTEGRAALGAVVFASLGLVLGDFFRLAPVLWGGLSALQITMAVAGLVATFLAARLSPGSGPGDGIAGAGGGSGAMAGAVGGHGSSRANS